MDDEDFGLGEEEAEQDLNSRVDDLKQAFVNEKVGSSRLGGSGDCSPATSVPGGAGAAAL